MSLQDLTKLREIVFENEDLQKSLQKIKERDLFILRLIEIGEKFDLRLEREEIIEKMRENQKNLFLL